MHAFSSNIILLSADLCFLELVGLGDVPEGILPSEA